MVNILLRMNCACLLFFALFSVAAAYSGIWSTGNITAEAPTTIKSDNIINNIDNNNNSINDMDSSKSLRQLYTCDSILGESLCPLEKIQKTVEVEGITIHYWIYQETNSKEATGLPVILINGGPGYPHNYMLPMKVLACQGHQVIFYDQAGTGLSTVCPSTHSAANPNDCDIPHHTRRILTLEHYVEEVSAIVSDLGLAAKGYHLFGHSFGTIHAINFAASSPKGLRSLVLGGALANSKVYIESQWDQNEGNLGTLPIAMQKNIRKYEADGAFDDPGYLAIVADLSALFMARTFPVPDCLNESADTFNLRVYNTLWGPSEFYMGQDAVIVNMDLAPQLRNISVPVLLIHGAFDTMRAPNIRQVANELKQVTQVLLPRSGHMTMVDQPLEMASQIASWW